ncbi:histidine kinase [Pedobacter petrophilus]|uniref:Histidine kinase n=1 Tax=Pedobacter petrophilus TaxID=1908241 RepID=A0A7K0G3P1_9SPHI|nr:two-component regulator propeller domain-containing protein [Pedobacter petrophilus]MRX77819.1 histidine kinase [Pedobacter petrophilus]
MKYIQVYALLLTVVFNTSCKQRQTNAPKDNISAETKDSISIYGPNSMVRNVKQDRKGNILIAASFGGILRYDGKSFTNLTSKLGSRRFWDVLEDRKGNLWFSSTDSGVYCYNGKSFQHFTTREGLASNAVMSVYEDRAGFIWFGTTGGASRYDGKSFRNFTTKQGLSNNGINVILEDKNGKLWFGTRGNACFYDGKTFTVFKNKDGKAFHNVWGITEDKKGHIWFGATTIEDRKGDTLIVKAGLWHYDGRAFTKINQKGTSAIIEDKKGNIWTTGAVNPNGVGAWTLSRYDQNSLYNKKPAVAEIMSIQKMLCGILEANDGSIWFGSLNGVYRYDGKTITDFKNKGGQN